MKILAIASGGGHWIELMKLKCVLDEHNTFYVTTNKAFSSSVSGAPFFAIDDVSRWNKWKLTRVAWQLVKLMIRLKPDYVISTGAAPGAVALVVGKLFGAKTIWVESLCHVEKISMSGKYVRFFSDKAYTQWSHLANKKFIYNGKVLSS